MTVQSGKLPWWFGVLFLLGGIVMLGFGFVLLQDELRYGREGVAVTGSVIEAVYSPGAGDNGPSYSIRFEFLDPATGTARRGESDVSEEAYDRAVPGAPIVITYLPAEPTKSRVGTTDPQLFIPAMVMGGGVLFGVIGLVALLVMRWARGGQREGGRAWVGSASGVTPDADDRGSNAILGMLGLDELVAAAREAQAAAEAGQGAQAAAAPDAVPAAQSSFGVAAADATADGQTTEADLRALDARLAPPDQAG